MFTLLRRSQQPAMRTLAWLQTRNYVYVHRRGAMSVDRPGRKKSAKQKQDERRRARIARFAPPEEELIYGNSVVLAALQSGRRELRELLVKDEVQKGTAEKATLELIMSTAKRVGVPVERVDKGKLNVLSDYQVHQGVVLRCSALHPMQVTSLTQYRGDRYYAVTPPTQLVELRTTGKAPVWLALDEVQDPRNLGAIVRSAYYFGIDGVISCRKNSSPYNPVCSKASAGAVELIDLYYTNKMMKFLRAARSNGWIVIGTTASPKSQYIPRKDLVPMDKLGLTNQPIVLVLGNEGYGLRNMVRKKCTHHVAIPATNTGRSGLIDSLNVSVASGILLNAIARNRLSRPISDYEDMVAPPNPVNQDRDNVNANENEDDDDDDDDEEEEDDNGGEDDGEEDEDEEEGEGEEGEEKDNYERKY